MNDPITGPADHKAAARAQARALRAAAYTTAQPGPALDLLETEAVRLTPRGGCIAGYAAIRSEIDPRPVMERLHTRGFRLCLPVVDGPAQPLTFRVWSPDTPMIVGDFGAMIPETDQMAVPDLLIVPLLAFDTLGYRLGYGGGFYDRTLERLRAVRPVVALGFAYAAQRMDRVPIEPTDQPLDAIVTEAGIVAPGAA